MIVSSRATGRKRIFLAGCLAFLACLAGASVVGGCGGTVSYVLDAGLDAEPKDAGAPSDVIDAADTANDSASDATDDSAGVFSVKNVPGLALWLDGTTGIAQNALRVSGWADRSGNGNHAGQATPGMQPAYLAGGIGGRPCVHFDSFANVGQMLSVPDSPTLQFGTGDFAVEVVARYDNDPGSAPELTRSCAAFYVKMVFAISGGGVGFFGNTPGNRPIDSNLQGITESSIQTWSTTTGYNDGVGRVVGFRRVGAGLEVRAGGVPVGTNSYKFLTDVSAPGIPLNIGATGGQGYPEGGLWRMNGDVCEVIAIKGSVSAGNLSAIETYLKAKYGL